jgi:hypothetical protein
MSTGAGAALLAGALLAAGLDPTAVLAAALLAATCSVLAAAADSPEAVDDEPHAPSRPDRATHAAVVATRVARAVTDAVLRQ